jgi:hypothetical protein
VHRDLIKKLIRIELSLLGECNVVELLTDQTHGVTFTDAEQAEMRNIYDEAWGDWLIEMAGGAAELERATP